MQRVKIDLDLVKYLSEVTEIVEVLDEGLKLLTTKNGVVMRETVGKWGQVLCEKDGVIWVEDAEALPTPKLPNVDEVVKALSEVQPIPEELGEAIAVLSGRSKKTAKKKVKADK